MKNPTIAGLDIGTTKTCAVVATADASGIAVVGVGEAPSAGMRGGVIVDLEATVRSIEAATERAERMAGVHVSEVYVGISGDHMSGTNSRGVIAVTGSGGEVARADVRRALAASRHIDLGGDRQIVHALPSGFTVDGRGGVADPIGLCGSRLEVETHVVTGSSPSITNVLRCVHRAGLETAGLVFEPLASSAATLHPQEKHIGVALLDIGGGTTDIVVYAGGAVVFSATIPVGGMALTKDISIGLQTTSAEAERLKRTYGFAPSPTDAGSGDIAVASLDGRTSRAIAPGKLREVAEPRVRETLALAKAAITERLPRSIALAEIVLTGGGAHLTGIADVTAEIFALPVRIGIPEPSGTVADAVRGPEYATAVGLVLFGPNAEPASWRSRRSNVFSRLADWFGDLWT